MTEAQAFLRAPPSCKTASGLSTSHEYAAIWTGQSNSLPWGYPQNAFEYAIELNQAPTGLDLSTIVIPDNADREVGEVEVLLCDGTVAANVWNTSTWLRLGTPTAPLAGYALVLESGLASLTVKWLSLPANDAIVAGYLVRETGRFASYDSTRVLTPYLPLFRDIHPPYSGSPNEGPPRLWTAPRNSPYPAANGAVNAVADGKRLTLPAPYTLPAAVTDFSDLGLFLPITRREGSNGYGISEIADATFGAIGDPTGHPITTISGQVFTFLNAISATADLTNGYLIVDWEQGGAARRSWARIATNGTTSFTTDAASWLGDLIPDAPDTDTVTFTGGVNPTITWGSTLPLVVGDRVAFTNSGGRLPDIANSTVTFDLGLETVIWASHGLRDGQPVLFETTGTLPTPLVAGTTYYVRNPAAGTFQLSATPLGAIINLGGAPAPTTTAYALGLVSTRVYYVKAVAGDNFEVADSMDHPVIVFDGIGTGTHTATRVWQYTAWIPHWKDNPFMWLPGPEFAYPNEDYQPRNTFIHFRARGHLFYAYSGTLTPFDGEADSRFGAMLPFAHRVSAAIGKRMNVVACGIGSTPLIPAQGINTAAGVYQGIVGWWNYEQLGFAVSLEDTTRFLSGRIKRLVTFVAVQALLAEGSAKTLRYLSAAHIQGEADANRHLAETYIATITDYKNWLRELVDSVSLSAYEGEARLPFVQPLITHFPWEEDPGGITYTDIDGFVNDSIKQAQTADEFAAYTLAEDLPKINGGHFSGGGMVAMGARLAAAALDLIDYGLSFSSAVLTTVNPRLLRLANLALSELGQGAARITSLTENTTESRAVADALPEAVRRLLAMRQWSWATRKEPATLVKNPGNPDWQYAYVVPGRALTPIAIEPPRVEGAGGVQLVPVVPPSILREQTFLETLKPESFEIGRSLSGHRLLFCNVAEIPGDTTEQVPLNLTPASYADIPNDLLPERLPTRATLHYIDKVPDPDRYSEAFAAALVHLLASLLAPALIKGQQGELVSASQYQKVGGYLRAEASHETVTRQHRIEHRVDWLDARS